MDPAQGGAWERLQVQIPFPAGHAALLPSGKVMLFPRGAQTTTARASDGEPSACLLEWESGEVRTWHLPADFSLGSHYLLPDGQLLIVGSDASSSALRLSFTYLFDPETEEFTRVSDLPETGPCPTLLGLGDGRVLVVGGGAGVGIYAYEKSTGWSPSDLGRLEWPYYPQLALLGDGGIFYSGQHFGSRGLVNQGVLRPDGRFVELLGATGTLDSFMDSREQGATVLLPPAQDQRLMVIESKSADQSTAQTLDLAEDPPRCRRAGSPHAVRSGFNTVLLPDGAVFVTGGLQDRVSEAPSPQAEIYRPRTDEWAVAANPNSLTGGAGGAVLLPDGSVLLAGPAHTEGEGSWRVEVYRPPYLFNGVRPIILQAPEEVRLAERFSVRTPDSDIGQVRLMKPVAASYGVDCGQRCVDVSFESRGGGMLELTAPANPNLIPPGWYLLFLLNHKGVPSQGEWVRVVSTGPVRPTRTSLVEDHSSDPLADWLQMYGSPVGDEVECPPPYEPAGAPQPRDDSQAGPVDSHPTYRLAWSQWTRPAVSLGATALLALAMVLDLDSLRGVAATVFLLFAPGLAVMGTRSFTGWANEVALAIGLSLALETLLTLAALYLGIWSMDLLLLVLVTVSIAGTIGQAIRASAGDERRASSLGRLEEVAA